MRTPTITATATSTSVRTLLVGDADLEAGHDTHAAGEAEAFLYTASTGGTANVLNVYVDATPSATQVLVGLYADDTTSKSLGQLLAQGTLAAASRCAWNAVSIPPTAIGARTRYWIAVLAPLGAGRLQYRDVASSGGPAATSSQKNLTSLPATWPPGTAWPNAPASAYAATN